MTVTVEVPPSVEAKLAADAAREGLPLPDYIGRVLAQLVTDGNHATGRVRPATQEALQQLHAMRDAMPPLGLSVKDLIEEGRER